MKTFTKIILLTGILVSLSLTSNAQWRMVLNSDHAPFQIVVQGNEWTYYFNPNTDTLTFSQVNKKPMKSNITIQVTLRNNTKAIYTTTDKNFSGDKTEIIVSLGDVYAAATSTKLPSKPKYTLNVMDRTAVREKVNFEFVKN